MRETIPLGGHHVFDRLVARRLLRFYRRFTRRRPEAQHILDVGCGPGHLVAAFAEQPDRRAIGIDLDPAQVRIARRTHGGRFEVGASHDLPIEDASQDWVLATETFHHWSQPDASAREIHRVLRPGGEFWIIEGAGDMTKDELAAWTGRRPFPGLTTWVRMIFTQHGYLRERLDAELLPVVSTLFDVDVQREDGWWVVRCIKAP